MANTLNYGFPKPDTAKNIDEEFYVFRDTTLDMIDAAIKAVADAAAGKSAVGHGHAIGDVAGLAAALESKMPASQTFSLDSLTDVDGATAAAVGQILWKTSTGWLPTSALAALGTHGHLISEITGLVDALAAKADAATAVRVDAAQSFTEAQQGQARANIGADVLGGFRNKIINPLMRVSQRAENFTIAAGGSAYVADRFVVENATNQTATVSINKPNLSVLSAVQNPSWMGIGFSVAPTTGTIKIRQPIEDVRTLAGKRATFGAMVVGADGSGGASISARLLQNFGIGGSANVSTDIPLNGSTVPSVASYVEGVVDIPSVGGKVLGTANDFLMPEITYSPRTTETTVFSLFYLVEGDCRQETDKINLVSPRHPQQEFALCQRYYEETIFGFGGYQAAGSSIFAPCFFKETKRTVPSLSTKLAPSQANVASINAEAATIVGFRAIVTATVTGTVALAGWTVVADAEF